jgi:hypothetical protein
MFEINHRQLHLPRLIRLRLDWGFSNVAKKLKAALFLFRQCFGSSTARHRDFALISFLFEFRLEINESFQNFLERTRIFLVTRLIVR